MNAASEVKNTVADVKAKVESHEQSKLLSETVEHLQKATDAIYHLVGSASSATSQAARVKLREGKEKVVELGHKVEGTISEKPLVSVGLAFAAGWLVSRLTRS